MPCSTEARTKLLLGLLHLRVDEFPGGRTCSAPWEVPRLGEDGGQAHPSASCDQTAAAAGEPELRLWVSK